MKVIMQFVHLVSCPQICLVSLELNDSTLIRVRLLELSNTNVNPKRLA